MNRSEFIRDQLTKNPSVKCKQVIAAWKGDGDIKPTLFYITKSNMKKKGITRHKSTRAMVRTLGTPKFADAAIKAMDESSSLAEIESALDAMIGKVSDKKVADALRQARRLVSAKLV